MTMRPVTTVVAAATIAFSVLSFGGASAATASEAHAPLGYQLMCLQHPGECQGGGKASITASPSVMNTLRAINVSVNTRITPKSDAPGTDVWTIDAKVGDCEEYVLAKRDALIRAGLPGGALRVAYVKTQSDEGHAVLIVETNHGELVLDNLTGIVRPLSQSGLRLIAKSSANPEKWI